ncbi:MAG: hypothetical protein ACYTF1_16805 [Planctomycetota bacterium]|jgi:hypothetical protein
MKELDFLPENYQQKLQRKRRKRKSIVALVIVTVILGSLHLLNHTRYRPLEKSVASPHSEEAHGDR